jgi:hypothetical protein
MRATAVLRASSIATLATWRRGRAPAVDTMATRSTSEQTSERMPAASRGRDPAHGGRGRGPARYINVRADDVVEQGDVAVVEEADE